VSSSAMLPRLPAFVCLPTRMSPPVPKPINHNADPYLVRAETSRVSATLPSTLSRTPSPSSRPRTAPPLVAAVCLVPCVLTTLLPVLLARAAVVVSVVAAVATPAPRFLSIKVGNLRALARVSRVGVWA
jgi:hypothetical protein